MYWVLDVCCSHNTILTVVPYRFLTKKAMSVDIETTKVSISADFFLDTDTYVQRDGRTPRCDVPGSQEFSSNA